MSLLAIGVNHDTTPIALRERLAVAGDELQQRLASLKQTPGLKGAALVSTCNRTEVYCRTAPGMEQQASDWLTGFARDRQVDIGPHLYRHREAAAVQHAFRVATGLDSMVIGEPQILGQMKQAWAQARTAQSLDRTVDRLFQRSFAVAKTVRAATGIGSGTVSVAYAGLKLARQVFDDFANRSALIYGAGETAELVGRHLRGMGVRRIVIANRTFARAAELANRLEAQAVAMENIGADLTQVDLIIGAAGGQCLSTAEFVAAYRKHRRRLVLMLDLGVPRTLDPALAALDDVILYDVDHLQGLADDGLKQRREAATAAEDLVRVQVNEFMAWMQQRAALDPLLLLRQRNQHLRDEQLAKATRELGRGAAPQAVIEQLATQLTNQLQHRATVALKAALASGDAQQIELLRTVLGLDMPNDERAL